MCIRDRSSDEFNAIKGKTARFSWEDRKADLEAIRYVDMVVREDNWAQKTTDVADLEVDVFTMGDDWVGKFDFLKSQCEVVYLERTPDISSTMIRTKIETS